MSAALIAPDGAGASGDGPEVDPAPDGRLLAVVEVQQALRELRARRVIDLGRSGGDITVGPITQRGDKASEETRTGGDSAFPSGWITVRAAHAGAGASTVALAITDVAAETGRRAHLIESAHPSRSGLVAAASAELGVDDTGMWRRGLRASVTIDRRVIGGPCRGWPQPPIEDDAVTLVDLGLSDDVLAGPMVDRTATVVVCRPTVPGVRLTEQLLDRLGERPVVIAAVGPSRWPGEVSASLGSRLAAQRDGGRVVAVPVDRRLALCGLTSGPLPRPVLAAGRALLGLLGAVVAASAEVSRATPTQRPTRERAHL